MLALLAPRPWSSSTRTVYRTALRTASSASTSNSPPPHPAQGPLTGSAKLFQDALEEEQGRAPLKTASSRDHLRITQGPVWDGDESTHDAVLRMLVDAHKPLRSGQGIKHTAAEDKIKGWTRGLKLEPRLGPGPAIPQDSLAENAASAAKVNVHKTSIPAHLHRPWHATYTGTTRETASPKVKYGSFINKKRTVDSFDNLLEFQLPPDADSKTRQRVRSLRKTGKVVKRYENAREDAVDYRLGLHGVADVVEHEGEEGFEGNRQVRGSSVLGAQKGGASGLRAWSGLVEDRIQRAKDAGFFNNTKGRGAPIVRDPEASNPHIERGELFMNRIVKKQGAMPPWIELQNDLERAITSFRSTLMTTYTNRIVRSVLGSTTIDPLPPIHVIPDHDPAWEARESKFHQESLRQINNLVRRMNAQAPFISRRGLYTLEVELDRIRGDVLRNAAWEEITARAKDYKHGVDRSALNGAHSSGMFARLGKLADRPISAASTHVSGGGSYSDTSGSGSTGTLDPFPQKSSGLSLLAIFAFGLGAVIYFRKPVKNDGPLPDPPGNEAIPAPDVSTHNREETGGFVYFILESVVEPVLTFFRFVHLFVLFMPVILLSPMLLVGKQPRKRIHGRPSLQEEENWGAVWWYGFLVKQMERAGPSFIKLGQWAASRTDLFPDTLCDKMSKLHSNGAPHALSHTKRVITEAFGMRFDDIFDDFGEEPIGCGAIAQVYRARIKPSVFGTKSFDEYEERLEAETHDPDKVLATSVAIKVLHPKVRKTIRRDIAIMSVFANAINALPGMQWISLPEEVAVFGDMMNSQLDLRVEAANLDLFRKNFKSRGHQVSFPRAIKLGKDADGTEREETRDVLMEEYEDALPLEWFLRWGGGPYDHAIANICLDAFLEMLLLDNFTHGDLHPGNIMVRLTKPTKNDFAIPFSKYFGKKQDTHLEDALPIESKVETQLTHELASISGDGEKWLARLEQLSEEGFVPHLIFIDAGLVTSLDGANRRNFLELFQAVAEFDGYKAGRLMVERCRSPEYVIDDETFALKIQHLVLTVKSKTFTLANIKISDILTQVMNAVRQHHVKLEGDFVNTVISILLLEGIGRQLDPSLDLFKSALPILRQLGRQMGTREAIGHVQSGNIWAMIKLWVWMEAREVAGEASAVDEWIKYDRLFPSI